MTTEALEKSKAIQFAGEQVDTGVVKFNLTDMLLIVMGALGILTAAISAFCRNSCDAGRTVRQQKDAVMSEGIPTDSR